MVPQSGFLRFSGLVPGNIVPAAPHQLSDDEAEPSRAMTRGRQSPFAHSPSQTDAPTVAPASDAPEAAPASDAPEAALIPDVKVYPIETLFALVMHLQGMQPIAPYRGTPDFTPETSPTYATDFSGIRGQEHVKRALEVAAAGQHNIFMLWATSPRI